MAGPPSAARTAATRRAIGSSVDSADTRRVSVVVPARNEEERLARVLECAHAGAPGEVIVVDGHSDDRTRDVARSLGARVLTAGPGRARQMNQGAAAARGDVLLFVHGDTLLPERFAERALSVLAQPGVVAGAFGLSIDAPGRSLRLIERCVAWRSRARSMPYGDQALFLAASIFAAIGGFPELPALEDYELVRGLRRLGRIGLADAAVVTSARRWCERGVWRTTLLNQLCIAAYRCGVSPRRIAGWRSVSPRR